MPRKLQRDFDVARNLLRICDLDFRLDKRQPSRIELEYSQAFRSNFLLEDLRSKRQRIRLLMNHFISVRFQREISEILNRTLLIHHIPHNIAKDTAP